MDGMDIDIDYEAILRTFLAESEEDVGKMEAALLSLEADPQNQKLLDAIFRGTHTLKGNAGSLGFPKVAGFAHVFEELLQRFRNRTLAVTQERITLLLSAVDALRQMIPEAIAGAEELQPSHVNLLHQLADGNPTAKHAETPIASAQHGERRSHFGRRQEDVQAWIERADTARVDIAKLDRMLNLAGEIAVAHGRLRQVLETAARQGGHALEAHEQLERLSLDLQEQIMKVRMVPVGPIFRQYLRIVRDVAQANGKAARLVLEGEDVEVDLSMVENLKDPLTHMIRNALDHGIEDPESRRTQGKDPCGVIMIKAHHDGATIVIEIIDDGAGLNRERIAKRVRAMRSVADSDSLSDPELYKFIFEPGFSTAEKITDLSGRGVGMDVVKRNIEALRGAITVESRQGQGTKITIRLPLTLAIIEGFAVGVGAETYILPLHCVRECLTMPEDHQRNNDACGVINLRGLPVPYLRLRNWYGLLGNRPTRESIVVIEETGMQVGLAVDQLYGAHQTVIKPLGGHLKNLPGIAGSAILGSGRVALIVDVSALIRDAVRSRMAELNGVMAFGQEIQNSSLL
jgi:two-component system chemotaxis sensor kinase CheA